MAEFKLPADPKKKAGTFLGLILAGGLALLAWNFVVPILATMVWNTVSLGIGIVALLFLCYIIFSKQFWSRSKMILDALGEILFRGFIEMNPFTILYMQLDKAAEDRVDLLKQNELLQGQASKLETQLNENQKMMKESAEMSNVCRKRLAANPDDIDTALLLETSVNDFNNSKDFVDTVMPIHQDIQELVVMTDKAYRKSGNALENAKKTVTIQKAKYDAVTTGSNAMKKALRAFAGDPEMNKAGDIALEKLRTDIARKVGTIRTCIKETSVFMNESDLRDAAKVNLATQTIKQLDIDRTFDYIPSAEMVKSGSSIPKSENRNKFLDLTK